jgi:hypothetical protein
MTPSQKFAYRGSLLALLVVFVVVVAAGFIGERIDHGRANFDKAEGFIADMHAVATQVPRLLDGSIVRQGELSSAWLDDVAALPVRLQALAGTLKGGEKQRSLGLVLRGPWSFDVAIATRDSLVWTQLSAMPQAICQQFWRAVAEHPEQAAYANTAGDPPVIPSALELGWLCRANFSNVVLVTLDPPTEVRRLAADIQNAVKAMPANLTEKMPITGSSAPFQVEKGQNGGAGFIQRDQSGIQVTINNVPFAVCRLALAMGPTAFGMDAFHAPDGKVAQPPLAPASKALCNDLKGHLIMSRR